MLIDQMKEHPEEFRGYAGKFTNMLNLAHEVVHSGSSRRLSMRDATAIVAAAETHLYEVWLAEDVLTTIMQPKVIEAQIYPKASTGVLRQGGSSISNATLYNTAISNTAASQYDQAYQLELAKLKAELEKQRLQEQDYALRITKPLGGF